MEIDVLTKKEALGAELIKAAKMEQRLIDIDEQCDLNSDFQVAVWACVAITQSLQVQLLNTLTTE